MELIGGIDEVGRGALAGPVVSSTVILPENHSISDLNDSKLLSPKKRDLLFKKITNQAISIGIGFANEKEIDSMNILNLREKEILTLRTMILTMTCQKMFYN